MTIREAAKEFRKKYQHLDGFVSTNRWRNYIIALIDEDKPWAAQDIPLKFDEYLVKTDYVNADDYRDLFKEMFEDE